MKLTTRVEWPHDAVGHTVTEPTNSYDVLCAHYSIIWALIYNEFSATLPV
jgi:hypothetical protein